jgi:hypothetical protein
MNDNNTVVGGKLQAPQGWEDMWWGAQPSVFAKELNKLLPYPLTGSAAKYWWRAQAAAYYLRLNPAALAEIVEKRFDDAAHAAFTVAAEDKSLTNITFPFPLPRGTTSMYVRHGDKGIEMTLHPLEEYVQKGEELAAVNPLYYSKMAYLSSEDPGVFEKAKGLAQISDDETTSNLEWRWYMSHINRRNGGPFSQLNEFGNRTKTTISWMSELLLVCPVSLFTLLNWWTNN